MDLVIITQSYPFKRNFEQTFLNQEIPFLANSFERLFIIPKSGNGETLKLRFDNIIIDSGYSNTDISNKEAITNLLNYNLKIYNIILRELITVPSIFFNPRKSMRMLSYLGQSYSFCKWMGNFIVKNNIDIKSCVFYTYWFQSTTTGLLLLKSKCSDIKIITRAHNIDLFEERNPFYYIPFRKQLLRKLDAIFPCMDAGKNYFERKYRINLPNIITSYLGVDDNDIINSPSEDGILRIVSCSRIAPVKRLELIIFGLKELIKLTPEQKIEWIHFGDGERRNEIENLVKEINDENVRVVLRGQVALSQIISHYKNNSVDVFINVSSYEGQPVSIKEAISFGIPIIATDVGGNSEIVTASNGILLNAVPTPIEIARAMNWFKGNHVKAKTMRVNSRKIFLKKYDSKVVYPNFIENVFSI